jgi:hypothetical protein
MRLLRNRTAARGRLASLAVAVLVGLAVMTPTGANAAANSLVAETSDAYMKGSCEFAVTRVNADNSATAKLTMKTLEIKPSIFSPRRVASAKIKCEVILNSFPVVTPYEKTNPSGATIYKSQYITTFNDPEGYLLCAQVSYTLRTGATGSTPLVCTVSS